MVNRIRNEYSSRWCLPLLMVFTFFMVIGFEMIMPLVVGEYVNVYGFSATAVAAALASRRFIQQGLALVGGTLADKWNIRNLICIGVLLRALGFVMLAFGKYYLILVLAMVLIGFGGVFFEMPYQTALAILTNDENRARYYSLNNTVSGIASTAGPLLGAVLLKADFTVVCFAAAFCFIVNFFVSILALPKIVKEKNTYSVMQSAKCVVKHKSFLIFVILMTVFWLAASQIDIIYPLRIQEITQTTESVSVMYAIYAAVTALLQYPLVSFLLKRMKPVKIVVIGLSLITIALLMNGICTKEFAFYVSVVMFAIGMLLARPNQQTILVSLADKQALGMFLGCSSLSAAIGCGMGTIFGGMCYDISKETGQGQMMWYFFAMIAMVATLGFNMMKRQDKKRGQE